MTCVVRTHASRLNMSAAVRPPPWSPPFAAPHVSAWETVLISYTRHYETRMWSLCKRLEVVTQVHNYYIRLEFRFCGGWRDVPGTRQHSPARLQQRCPARSPKCSPRTAGLSTVAHRCTVRHFRATCCVLSYPTLPTLTSTQPNMAGNAPLLPQWPFWLAGMSSTAIASMC